MTDCAPCEKTCAGCPKVVAIGGGHGLAVTIRAARRYAGQLTAVVATADDGGSTGRLRAGMSLPAPGDLRRCLVAMAGAEDEPLGAALDYRFDGTDVEGHALGNLVLAGLTAVTGDFLAATDEVARLLGTDQSRHRVAPATTEPAELHAVTTDGAQIRGQVAVAGSPSIGRVALKPEGLRTAERVADAIDTADQILLGPGDLYTSVLAAALVEDVRTAVADSPATRVYVCNLRSDNPETKGYDLTMHVDALRAHGVHPDVVLADPTCEVGRHSDPMHPIGAEVVLADLSRPHGLAHDPSKLATALAALA